MTTTEPTMKKKLTVVCAVLGIFLSTWFAIIAIVVAVVASATGVK